MKTNQYRVWNVKNRRFDEDILLAADGTLWLGVLVVNKVALQLAEQNQYIAEFATGYLDTADKMIYDGDIVHINNGGNCAITWGEFSDCCVEGETWVYAIGSPHKATLGSLCSDDVEFREVTIIGNIHETPSLLEQEQP